jgi:hypothetical protein
MQSNKSIVEVDLSGVDDASPGLSFDPREFGHNWRHLSVGYWPHPAFMGDASELRSLHVVHNAWNDDRTQREALNMIRDSLKQAPAPGRPAPYSQLTELMFAVIDAPASVRMCNSLIRTAARLPVPICCSPFYLSSELISVLICHR